MIYHDRRKIIYNEQVYKVSNLVYSKLREYKKLFFIKSQGD